MNFLLSVSMSQVELKFLIFYSVPKPDRYTVQYSTVPYVSHIASSLIRYRFGSGFGSRRFDAFFGPRLRSRETFKQWIKVSDMFLIRICIKKIVR
jgi:hypothetical protein